MRWAVSCRLPAHWWQEALPENRRGAVRFLLWLGMALLAWWGVNALLHSHSEGRLQIAYALQRSVPAAGFTPPERQPPDAVWRSPAGQAQGPLPVEVDAAADLAQGRSGPQVWHRVELPHVQEASPVPQAPVMTDWYHFTLDPVRSPEQLGSEAQATGQEGVTYLYLPRWKNTGTLAIYSDGQLVYRTHTSLVHNGYNTPLLVPLDAVQGASPPREVLLRIQRPADEGGMLSTVWMGDYRALRLRYEIRYALQVLGPQWGSAAFLVLGVYALLIWMRRRRDVAYLLYFAATSMGFLRMLHYHVNGPPLGMSDAWFQWLTVNSLAWSVLFLHLLLQSLHRRFMPRLTYSILAITVVLGALTLPPWNVLMGLLQMTPWINLAIVGVSLVLFTTALINTWLSRIPESWVLTGWCSVGVILGAQDLLMQLHRISPEGMYWAPYSFLGSYAAFATILFRRYADLLKTEEERSAELQRRLKAREAELMRSHAQLREIEQRETLHQERQRLVQDMHDGMGYSLTTALHSVERGRMSPQDVADVLRQCVDDLKLAIDSMEPVESDLLLLLATLRFRLEPRLRSAGLKLRWQVEELPALDWLDPKNALHILRILQEALSNVVKHSRATEVTLTTRTCAATPERVAGVEVEVRDNGRGFDVRRALHQGGRGLSHQRRRAEAIGAEVCWQSDACGTVLRLWLPLVQAWEEGAAARGSEVCARH